MPVFFILGYCIATGGVTFLQRIPAADSLTPQVIINERALSRYYLYQKMQLDVEVSPPPNVS